MKRPRLPVVAIPELTGQEVKDWRHRTMLSQGMAARYLGVAVTTFKAWEMGRRQPWAPVRQLMRYIEKHGVLP